jgi:hypothetical protein
MNVIQNFVIGVVIFAGVAAGWAKEWRGTRMEKRLLKTDAQGARSGGGAIFGSSM